MNFRINGLPVELFRPLFALAQEEVARAGARRCIADTTPGFPCRVTLEDAAPGESVLLLNYVHQPADTPYRASHAVYVRENAMQTASFVDAVPPALRARTLAVRAFDAHDMMTDAGLVAGGELESLIEHLFSDAAAAYLHVHYAARGCYAARVDRI